MDIKLCISFFYTLCTSHYKLICTSLSLVISYIMLPHSNITFGVSFPPSDCFFKINDHIKWLCTNSYFYFNNLGSKSPAFEDRKPIRVTRIYWIFMNCQVLHKMLQKYAYTHLFMHSRDESIFSSYCSFTKKQSWDVTNQLHKIIPVESFKSGIQVRLSKCRAHTLNPVPALFLRSYLLL